MPGVAQRPSRWGANPAFWVSGREFVHHHAGEIEVRVTRWGMAQALSNPKVVRRSPHSDWVQIAASETELIVRLARAAADANRAELRRRRAPSLGGR